MTGAPLRHAPTLLLAALGAACGGHKSPAPVAVPALCELTPPQPSALPTYAPATVPASPTQAVAIAFGVQTTGQTVSFYVPTGTASVTIVEQAASSAVPLTVSAGTALYDNTPVPLSIVVAGVGNVFNDVPMPPNTALRVLQPSGLTVLDPASDPSLAAYFYSSGAWTGALTLPNTSTPIPGAAPAVPAGTWTVTVGDWAYECSHFPWLGCTASATPSSYDVTVVLKPAAAPPGALKVVFYLVTNTGLTAATASAGGYPHLVRLQWAVSQILAQAGIAPAFQYRDVPADVRLAYATGVDANSGGVCGGMDQLLGLAQAGNQLNVFLVDLIKDSATGGYTTVGLDPIVPGPASFGGTPASGVLVSLENLGKVRTGTVGCPQDAQGNYVLAIGTCGDDATAAVAAHEAGHFLGLYHDTESIGTMVDPIADTPTCLCPVCKPPADPGQCQGFGTADPQVAHPYQMLVADCLGAVAGCSGGDNLMFWLLASGSKGLLTPGQAAVMKASPLVQ